MEDKLMKIGLTNGKLVKYSKDPETLRKVLSEGLYQAISLYTNETKAEHVKIMMADVLEDCKFDPIEVITETITDIRKGRVKIYGRVTPDVLHDLITQKRETIALARERQHTANKGYSKDDPGPRSSGRIQEPQRLKEYLKK